ncbi:MAG: hypothetical protein LBI67_07760 [Treponema sp.]|jgi:hypothetical protein|nr:hypothetical protein [Treponema sp.]
MSGSDSRSGRHRRHYRGNSSQRQDRAGGQGNSKDQNKPRYDKNGVRYERLRWVPPRLNTDPFPEPECVYCGKSIKDLDSAIEDKASGGPAHFDCVISKLAESESLEKGETISYIGAGRFGIVRFNETRGEVRPAKWDESSQGISGRVFSIRKILELEDREGRADWRLSIADHYSIT